MIGKGADSATIPEPEIGSLGGKDRGPLQLKLAENREGWCDPPNT